ncbi:MAG: HisA/HisF-related TIM barrel protein [Methylotenera sp.]|uniref:HisA/HisF-related TIM barrel protein n=1 Tax=Methylotenera sp. TaxID=2051956 RepID=UPI00271C2125|nr:HisA/HisF-related TIM barrel protein [Methylotenera sp.]MDO9151973.1 HisA/HisF-related TIM barrel protein [Methylotenera sp.]
MTSDKYAEKNILTSTLLEKLMQIIPVIDLLNGIVVHAKKGDRQHYLPITSQLTLSSEPLDIVAALLMLHPFEQLYIADLNAIQKISNPNTTSQSNNFSIIELISLRYPNLTIWVDAGISNIAEFILWSSLHVKLILGSENFSSIEQYITSYPESNTQHILSLDFMPNGYQGPLALLENTTYWPQEVIIMSLAHVGANQGTNIQLLSKIKQQASTFHIYAAGGVRGVEDLYTLKSIGIHGALIATALHDKQLSHEQLSSLQQ